MDAIVVEDLEKRYKDVQALAGVSFSVRPGEVFALLLIGLPLLSFSRRP